LENLYDWLGWTFIRKTKPANVYFLSQGRGQKVRASVNTHSTEIVVMFKKLDLMRPPAMLGRVTDRSSANTARKHMADKK